MPEPLLPTTVVGSYPQPDWLVDHAVLKAQTVPPQSLYSGQHLEVGNLSATSGYGYLTTRDGTQLSVQVVLPGPPDEGPYPAVMEYSGYDPSSPSTGQPQYEAMLPPSGYAWIGVNIRGTGCSGGAFNFFEVEALVETVTAPSIEEIRLMLRTLLAERFRLQVRREPVEMPVFVLAPAEGELKTTACADPKAASSYVPGRIVSCTPPLPMARFAQFLSRETGRMVLDQTGREAMTFELHWLPDTAQPQPDSPPSLFTALREQLGLKLEAQRAPVDAIVVVHAERPSAN